MTSSVMTVSSRLEDRPICAVGALVNPGLDGSSRPTRIRVRFRVETKRSRAGQGESQAYDFNLSLEDAQTLRAKLDKSISIMEGK
jgi:hypothetical protein